MPKSQQSNAAANDDLRLITPETLRAWPLPQPDANGDKNDRGSVLVIGGAIEMPGAIILAGIAALRAGAGKLQLATARSVAPLVATAVLEARVLGAPDSADGGIAPEAADQLAERANQVQAALIGPGMIDMRAVKELMQRLMPQIEQPTLVLDAAAMECAPHALAAIRARNGNVILTPNAGEMATLLEVEKDEVERDRRTFAQQAAAHFNAVVALKGAETYIADPAGSVYCYEGGTIGLGTSGAGDTLSGVIVGLAARGASPAQAAAWGVYLHSTAGERLSKRVGKLGFLARECLPEIPQIMAEFDEPEE
jgi:hydroxyethylthiazole kinase-like uncharacterized protein yjeF